MSFCKVCYDAGKPKADYTTHYVRDRPGGKVICPTILNQQCKYCKKLGHTPSHCPELEGKYKKAQEHAKQEHVKQHDQSPKKEAREARLCESPPIPRSMRQKRAARLCESPPPMRSAVQERAARLCESPPPSEKKSKNYFKSLQNESDAALSENFPAIGHTDSGKIIRPEPLKMNVWSSIVQTQAKQAQAQQAQAKQAQAKQAQAQQAQAPKEQEQEIEVNDEVNVEVEVKTNPYAYTSSCWADCE